MLQKTILYLLLCWPVWAFAQNAAITHSYTLAEDVVWAAPDGFDLTMDIYTPDTGQDRYPVIVIVHGGAWLMNNKSNMTDMAQYLASHGEYVVCNINYRLLSDARNTIKMNQIVEDVFGAVLWVKDHVAAYQGDPEQVIITGDSAGGHLASAVVVMGHMLSSTGFTHEPLGFAPTYLPKGKTAEEVAAEEGLAVQAAVINYGAFDIYAAVEYGFETPQNFFWQMGKAEPRPLFGKDISFTEHPDWYRAVSPIYNILDNSERPLPPQFFTVGTRDNLTTPATVKAYVDQLQAAGHPVSYWEYEDQPHAYLSSGGNTYLGTVFKKDAPAALDKMLAFLDAIFIR